MNPKTKLLEDQIKWLQEDIKKIDKGEQSGSKEDAIRLLREKQNKLKELTMDKAAKGIDQKDITQMKKYEEKELKERTKKYDDALDKADKKPSFDIKDKPKGATSPSNIPERNVGIDASVEKKADGLPTLKSQWEEKKDVEKRDPFKYVSVEKKKAALAILRKSFKKESA